MLNSTCKYFAAANGFSGFRSYFGEIFSSEEYEAIFILKGGPGTGKSSFMNKIHSSLSERCTSSEMIYCSSDPHSLDGVILTNKEKKIAILDGTSPHERDAVIPGVIDEIVNLGEGWNSEALRRRRSDILHINKLKKQNYINAYELLCRAGSVYDQINRTLSQNIDHIEIGRSTKALITDVLMESGTLVHKKRLLLSFGKYGLYTINNLDGGSLKKLTVNKASGAEYIFMRSLYENIKGFSTSISIFPSPLEDGLIDAIVFENSNIAVSVEETESADICTDRFIKKCSIIDKDYLDTLNEYYRYLLENSRKYFEAASKEHSELEKIYSREMNFEINNKKCEETEEKIKNVLSL